MVAHMIEDLMSAQTEVANVYKVGLNTSRLLFALGDLLCSWLLLRGAEIALLRLSGNVPADDRAFYEGKVAAARFFAQHTLPKISAERAIAVAIDDSLMRLDEESF